jgi:Glycosyltransferase family 87
MNKIDYRRLFVMASLGILILTYALLWLRMIETPIEYTGTDFVAFYAAAEIAHNEGPAHVYDEALQQKYEEALIGAEISWDYIRIYVSPPFFVPFVQPFALPDFVSSLILWNGMMLAFLVAGTLLLIPLLRGGFTRKAWLVLLAGILLFFPAYKSIIEGQNSAMVYLGACAWMVGVLMEKDWLGGLGLAVMTVQPHLVLPLALPFLFSNRRKVWWWFVLGAVALAGFSLVYVGVNGVKGFLQILALSGNGANLTTNEIYMVNLIGVLFRTFPGMAPTTIRFAGWSVYFITILGLCIYWARSPRIGARQISLAAILCVFTAPHVHLHSLVLLIVPLASFILLGREKNIPGRDMVLVPLGISFLFLLSFFNAFLTVSVPYIVMLALFLLVWFPDKIYRKIKPKE